MADQEDAPYQRRKASVVLLQTANIRSTIILANGQYNGAGGSPYREWLGVSTKE